MFANKPTPPLPLEHWFGDANNVEGLRAIIESPVYARAAATLIGASQPSFRDIITDDDTARRRQAWLAGYNDAFKDLLKLTQTRNTPDAAARANALEEWAHIVTPNQNIH
jgi:hypothetical protein